MKMPERALTEVEAAAAAGYRRFKDFRRDLRKSIFPAPDLQCGDGPRWSETTVSQWLRPTPFEGSVEAETEEILGKLRDGDEAASPGPKGPPRR